MIFSLSIQSTPFSAASFSALQFAEALLLQGHQLYRGFFYHEGVYHGSSLVCPPQGEFDPIEGWRRLQTTYHLDLVVCIAAALKRGILDAGEAERYEKVASNLHPEFQLSGLGQWVDAVVHSDRVLTFAG